MVKYPTAAEAANASASIPPLPNGAVLAFTSRWDDSNPNHVLRAKMYNSIGYTATFFLNKNEDFYKKEAIEMLKEYYLRKILFASESIVKQLYHNEDRDSDYTNCQSKISGNLAFNSRGLYDRLTSSRKQYVEKLGVFYRGEENGTTDKSTINKTEKKVITYEDVNP